MDAVGLDTAELLYHAWMFDKKMPKVTSERRCRPISESIRIIDKRFVGGILIHGNGIETDQNHARRRNLEQLG